MENNKYINKSEVFLLASVGQVKLFEVIRFGLGADARYKLLIHLAGDTVKTVKTSLKKERIFSSFDTVCQFILDVNLVAIKHHFERSNLTVTLED